MIIRSLPAAFALTGLFAFSALAQSEVTGLPAFPSAEGFGRFARGGRGGDVYIVTHLNDSGSGSLRHGLETMNGPRTIVFEVSGTIDLKSNLVVREVTGLTVAGQTAPGEGITLKNRTLRLTDVRDVVIRYLRLRLGDESETSGDVITLGPAQDVILDHLTATWGVDGTMDTQRLSNFTLQWSIFGEALHDSTHHKGPHAMLMSFRKTVGSISIHHNLLASSRDRHPTLGGVDRNALFDFRNNLIYNRSGSTNLCAGRFVLVENYYRPGPNTNLEVFPIRPKTDLEDSTFGVFENNYFEQQPERTADNYLAMQWGVRGGKYKANVQRAEFILSENPLADADRPTTQSAQEACQLVLQKAGASLHRDTADRRLIEGVRNRTHRLIDSQSEVGGWPALKNRPAPKDTDRDGMPDEWERKWGLNPDDPEDRNGDPDGDGYTNLEEYLNGACCNHG